MAIDETYSPLIHRVEQAIRRRAVQPDEGVTPAAEVLLKWTNPPAELLSTSASQLKRLIAIASVKKGRFTEVNIHNY